MKLLDKFLDLLYPHKCICCEEVTPFSSDDCFCSVCREKWEAEKNALCPTCSRPIRECWCGVSVDKKNCIDGEYHLVAYDKSDNVVRRLLYSAKNFDNKRLFDNIAAEITAEIIPRMVEKPDVIMHIPRSTESIKRKGHDQSLLIAKQLSKLTGIERLDLLLHTGNVKQKKLTQAQREDNAKSSYKIKNGAAPYLKGKVVCLIDDVITTGHTVARAAYLAKLRGANRVYVIAIAKTIK